MIKVLEIEEKYNQLERKLSAQFADGDTVKIDAMLYLIGVQELGKGFLEFSKDDKLNLMHIAVCKIFEPFGHYKYSHMDEDGWPHYEPLTELPELTLEQQELYMKEAIITYFKNRF
ncbi:MAG: hypothetical protein KGZ87_03795 [Bacteroidetes bacterium]|jgi:hypothetical protein|nr:hypothetical protein [Bacteroidota bacterium]